MADSAQTGAEFFFNGFEHFGDRLIGLHVLQGLFVIAQANGKGQALVTFFYLVPLVNIEDFDGLDEAGITVAQLIDNNCSCDVFV